MVVYDGKDPIYADLSLIRWFSTMFNEVITMIGEPENVDEYTLGSVVDNPLMTMLIYAWFTLTVFITAFIFLNILLANIQDTFHRVWSKR